MKRSGFRQQSPEEIRKKEALKRKKLQSVAKKPKSPLKAKNKLLGARSKPKVKTQAWLKKELDRVFSIYIRQKYDKSCYTCGKVGTLQNGHFVSRQYLATRWDENNCRPQCVGCNLFGNGKPLDFEERLKKDLGCEFVEIMKKKRHLSMKLDRNWYRDQIDMYKEWIT